MLGKGAHATIIIAILKRLWNEDVERRPSKNMGESHKSELQLESVCRMWAEAIAFLVSKQRRRWRLTCVKVGLHCYRVVQRPLSTWKTIWYLTWTSRSQSLEDQWRCTGAWAPAWIAPGIADVIFQQDLAAAHAAVNISTWCKDCGIPVLHWPANSWNPSENLWAIVKRKMRDTRSNYAEEPKVTIRATWTSCYRLTTSRPGS